MKNKFYDLTHSADIYVDSIYLLCNWIWDITLILYNNNI